MLHLHFTSVTEIDLQPVYIFFEKLYEFGLGDTSTACCILGDIFPSVVYSESLQHDA
jgi:hypothetical protein